MTVKDTSSAVTHRHFSRRALLHGGAGAFLASGTAEAAAPASNPTSRPAMGEALPLQELGKTGLKITRLVMGAGYPSYQRPLLEHAFRCGIRCFDNSYGYGNGAQERVLGDWINKTSRRSDVIVITKAGLTSPDLFYGKVTRALDHLSVDTIDMMFLHGIEDPAVPLDRSGEWRQVKDRLVREKKVRFMGFSTHAEMSRRGACLKNAAQSGWVDAVLVGCDPLILRTDDSFNRAVDACVKAGVGLVAMKTTRGLGLKAAQRRGLPEGQAETEQMPGFDDLGLSAFGAVHYGIWSDGRFASICSAMLNRRMLDENTRNARQFARPLDREKWQRLEEGMRQLTRATCPNCDGSCRRAAGTEADFSSIARYLAYYEEDGDRDRACRLYRELAPELKDWQDADLAAASHACPASLDFEAILTRASQILA